MGSTAITAIVRQLWYIWNNSKILKFVYVIINVTLYFERCSCHHCFDHCVSSLMYECKGCNEYFSKSHKK